MIKRSVTSRYGIGEWYGRLITRLNKDERAKYSTIKKAKKVVCPHRNDLEMCNKKGGVCSIILYRKGEDNSVIVDPKSDDLVTICPNRFWQNNTIFKEIGQTILNTENPKVLKEVKFLQSIDFQGRMKNDYAGKIDTILTRVSSKNSLIDWCALEIQAVYFSGEAMGSEFNAIQEQPKNILFPAKSRRPDFRSSGPKRLMPQLEMKIPTIRRWGKKMAIVIDKPFYESMAPMRNVNSLSNADIAWFVINYDSPGNTLRIYRKIFTTLESSVEGLTSGVPISKELFENQLINYMKPNSDKLIKLFD